MKAIVIEPDRTVWPGVDSAVLRPGEPVFVADPADAWRCRVVPAVRISRLGMHISPANVHRHIDAITVFHLMTPATPCAGMAPGLIDRTFSPGAWMPLDSDGYSSTFSLRVARGPIGGDAAEEIAVEFSPDALGVTREIARLSQMCTFRTGDVILFAEAGAEIGPPCLDTFVRATLNGHDTLNIRIK